MQQPQDRECCVVLCLVSLTCRSAVCILSGLGQGFFSMKQWANLAICVPTFPVQVWIVDDGKITFYNGDFEDYKDELIKEIAAELDEDEEAA